MLEFWMKLMVNNSGPSLLERIEASLYLFRRLQCRDQFSGTNTLGAENLDLEVNVPDGASNSRPRPPFASLSS